MLTILNNKIRISDSKITSNHDEDSWIFKITDILSHKPENWKNSPHYSIIKSEFDEVTRKHLEKHEDDNEYREHLIHLASACVNALMKL